MNKDAPPQRVRPRLVSSRIPARPAPQIYMQSNSIDNAAMIPALAAALTVKMGAMMPPAGQ